MGVVWIVRVTVLNPGVGHGVRVQQEVVLAGGGSVAQDPPHPAPRSRPEHGRQLGELRLGRLPHVLESLSEQGVVHTEMAASGSNFFRFIRLWKFMVVMS